MLTINLLLLIAHVIGVALGAGGATMSDILFLTSVADRQIDRSELKLLKIASKVVVAGLVLLTITGIGFLLTGSLTSPRFWAKMTIVTVAAVNGYAMHRYAFPLFEQWARDRMHLLSAEIIPHIPPLVTAGTISALSWYSALILGMWRTLPLTYLEIMVVYMTIVSFAVFVSNVAIGFFLRDPDKVIERLNKTTGQVRQLFQGSTETQVAES